jgi:arsenate reductase
MKKVLFVCVENSCRSQIAEGFARELGRGTLEPYSAGSAPAKEVYPKAVDVMREEGIDISESRPKGFSDLPEHEFDYVITMGCAETCPFIPAKKHLEWDISDPKGKDMEYFREVRDLIKMEVESLIKEV